MKLELIATATFGLEAVVRREIEGLGFKVTEREDGRITYIANEAGLARSNLRLRCADRVLLKMGAFGAQTFEELFQGMRGIAWETLVPIDGRFTVGATSVKSRLSSVPAIQSVAEKALVERLSSVYGIERFDKSGAPYDIRLRVLKDEVTVAVDTSGSGLHKRGYRTEGAAAPIKETLASALVQLSFWKPGRLMADPLCGSGTLAIEAAMIGRGVAPGLGRRFASEGWGFVPPETWKAERAACYKLIDHEADVRIIASDVDARAVSAARENADNAGVGDCITFAAMPFSRFAESAPAGGVMVCNPPYGERIGERKEMDRLYAQLAAFFEARRDWSLFLITSDKGFEQAFGRPADRRRKLYNGRIETTYYQYHGERPPKA